MFFSKNSFSDGYCYFTSVKIVDSINNSLLTEYGVEWNLERIYIITFSLQNLKSKSFRYCYFPFALKEIDRFLKKGVKQKFKKQPLSGVMEDRCSFVLVIDSIFMGFVVLEKQFWIPGQWYFYLRSIIIFFQTGQPSSTFECVL